MSKPVCVFQSPLFTRSGYGEWSLDIANSLIRYDKLELYIAPTRWGSCSKKNLEEDIKNPALISRILKSALPRQPEVFIQCTIPNEFQTPAKFNIGMTAGIETTVPKPEWIEGLNRMDLNIGMSVHCVDVFKHCAFNKTYQDGRVEPITLSKPMEVLSWAANTKVFKKTDEISNSVNDVMNKIKEDFAFLFVGQWTSGGLFNDRKDIGNLVKTFLEAFKNYKNKPCLILKTSGAAICEMDKNEILLRINEIEKIVKRNEPDADLPKVYLVYGDLKDEEMNCLFNHKKVKCHVSFTHGEGFGHPLLLATLTGKPLLAPGWSGQVDFLNPIYANYLTGEVKDVPGDCVNEWIIKESKWFHVDYRAAVDKMKSVFHYYGRYLEDAEKLRVENESKFNLEVMDKNLHAILDKHLPAFATEQKLILPKLLNKVSLPKLNKPSE